jgi:two-component system, chemotaxis family, response regulator Rcp1
MDLFIAVIEDNPADVRLIREALEENGVQCELRVIRDGHEAVGFIQDIESQSLPCPSLFIVDMSLPKKSGREVLEHIRQGEKCRQVPVVVLSSSDSQQDRDDALRLGVTHYLRKPSRLEEFVRLGAVFKQVLTASVE